MIEQVTFDCPGYSLAADWYPRDSERILIFLIGWTASRTHYREMLTKIADQTGLSIVCFDYSGHGDSPFHLDDTRPAQHLLEAVNVYDQLRKERPNASISLMGSSYGSYLAATLSQQRQVQHLVLCAPAIYQPEDFYTLWGEIDVGWTRNVYRHDTGALRDNPLLQDHKAPPPTLVMVHGRDDLVPATASDSYIEAFHAQKFLAPDLEHSLNDDLFKNGANQAYVETICRFLQS
ncbi:MAG: Prolyl oligopeptidase family protein [Candidatus Saccharibacteria bacterium]|nr:Prolyl oligopeptidase family protein [Candidatus Saccharibacteria bacterium]